MSDGPTLVGGNVRENSDDDSEVALVVPEHGRGALLTGGMPGNKGGPGRPPSRIRQELRGDFDSRKHVLRDIVDGVVPLFRERCPKCAFEPEITTKEAARLIPSAGDRIRALETQARYGLGEMKRRFDDELIEALGSAVADEVAPEVWEHIRSAWVLVIGEHVRGQS